MAFLDGASNLEDVLGARANNAVAGVADASTQNRRRLIGKLGAGGRLRSGVGNYDLTDADTAEANSLNGIYGNLASVLGGIPAENYGDERQNSRNTQLAELIAKLNKPSTLQEVLGGIGQAGSIAGTAAAFL